MPIRVQRLSDETEETLPKILGALSRSARRYPHSEEWSPESLCALPRPRSIFVASEEGVEVGLLVLTPGLLEPWGTMTALLGGNPIVPIDEGAPAIHTALLLEASAWIEQQGETGMEILLPMGEANMTQDVRRDAFFERLGFERSYRAMTRDLTNAVRESITDLALEVAPAAALVPEELYAHYAACLAGGESELLSRQSAEERRADFDVLLGETLAEPGSLGLFSEDALLGFALVAELGETRAHLAWIGILPGHRHRGHGRLLLSEVVVACRDRGVDRMSLYVDERSDAVTFFDRAGFDRAGTLTYRWRCQRTSGRGTGDETSLAAGA